MTIRIKNALVDKIRNIFFGNRFLSYPEYRLKKYIEKVCGGMINSLITVDRGVGIGLIKNNSDMIHRYDLGQCEDNIKIVI